MKNYWEDHRLYNDILDKYGSPYAAVMCIAKTARNIAESCDNAISHSSALNWVVTGDTPKNLLRPEAHMSYRDRCYSNALDRLNYVDDLAVKESVFCTILNSREEGHLIYSYKDNLSDSQKSRVRILSNIIWEEANTGDIL